MREDIGLVLFALSWRPALASHPDESDEQGDDEEDDDDFSGNILRAVEKRLDEDRRTLSRIEKYFDLEACSVSDATDSAENRLLHQ